MQPVHQVSVKLLPGTALSLKAIASFLAVEAEAEELPPSTPLQERQCQTQEVDLAGAGCGCGAGAVIGGASKSSSKVWPWKPSSSASWSKRSMFCCWPQGISSPSESSPNRST